MKRSISLIYRLFYMILSVWAILQLVNFNLKNILPALMNVTCFSDVLCAVIILVCFLFTIFSSVPEYVLYVKRIFTLLACIVIIINSNLIFEDSAILLAVYLLLPILFVADFLLFDKKRALNLKDFLIGLITILLIGGLLAWAAKVILGTNDFASALGLGNNLMDLLLKITAFLGAAVVLNAVLSSGEKQLLSLLMRALRIAYLVSLLFAFSDVFGKNINIFFEKVVIYELFVNVLCFLFVAVALILSIFKTGKSGGEGFSRLRMCFVFLAVSLFVINTFLSPQNNFSGYDKTVFLYVTPIYMMLEWLYYNKKGSIKWFDPLCWIAVMAIYFAIIFFINSQIPDFIELKTIDTVKWLTIFAYSLFVLDHMAKRS